MVDQSLPITFKSSGLWPSIFLCQKACCKLQLQMRALRRTCSYMLLLRWLLGFVAMITIYIIGGILYAQHELISGWSRSLILKISSRSRPLRKSINSEVILQFHFLLFPSILSAFIWDFAGALSRTYIFRLVFLLFRLIRSSKISELASFCISVIRSMLRSLSLCRSVSYPL